MGSRGMRGDEGERSNVMPNAQCPMPNLKFYNYRHMIAGLG
ncbi:hypothetical protein [Nostoc sp.]